jgi:hypothetical protein
MNGSITDDWPRWARAIAQRTVWSQYNTAKIPPRYQLLYQVVLPFKFAVIGLYGALSIGVPISSIDKVFGVIYGDMWSVGLLVAGFGAMIGIMFYDWAIKLEALMLVIMLTLMGFYVACIFIAGLAGLEAFRVLSLLIVVIFVPMPAWRMWDVIRELRPPRVLD